MPPAMAEVQTVMGGTTTGACSRWRKGLAERHVSSATAGVRHFVSRDHHGHDR